MTKDDYLKTLQSLLPSGRAWTRDPDATLTDVLSVFAFALAQVDRQAHAVLAAWKDDYNNVRPHSSLGDLTPSEFIDRSACRPQRGEALRYAGGSAPHPVASPSPLGSNVTGTLLIGG